MSEGTPKDRRPRMILREGLEKRIADALSNAWSAFLGTVFIGGAYLLNFLFPNVGDVGLMIAAVASIPAVFGLVGVMQLLGAAGARKIMEEVDEDLERWKRQFRGDPRDH